MMLSAKQCTPCQGGIPPMNLQDAQQHLEQLTGWSLEDNGKKIKKKFKFPNFLSALSFVNQVGQLCEDEGHHADIHFGWGYATVYFQTHKIDGLHLNDFIMAAKLDQLNHL